jgi:hypothetical protein
VRLAIRLYARSISCSVGLSRLAEKQGYIGGRLSLRAIAPETTAQEDYLGGSGLAILEVIAPADFEKYFVELAEGRFGGAEGFEPLTSAVQVPARLTGSSLPFLGGSSATSATGGAGLSPTPVPAPCVASASNVSTVSTRTAWLPVAASKRRTITSSSTLVNPRTR